MFDTHCHIDLYPDPRKVVAACEEKGLYTVAVTNAPSVFPATEKLVEGCRYVRAAVGIHPELVEERRGELPQMWKALERTRYVGEIGIDYAGGKPDRVVQRRVFTEVLQRCHEEGNKILTVHSRRAAADVIDAIGSDFQGVVILHWFSGSLKHLRLAVQCGHYFSVNPAMASSQRFRAVLSEIPADRVLLESDGPFVKIGDRPAKPSDVMTVVKRIADIWDNSERETADALFANFRRVLETGSTSVAAQ